MQELSATTLTQSKCSFALRLQLLMKDEVESTVEPDSREEIERWKPEQRVKSMAMLSGLHTTFF